MLRLSATIIFFLCLTTGALAQQTITGEVTAASDGETLPGVNIVVEGTNAGTSTEADGTYELEVPADAEALVFSYVGYQQQTVEIGNQQTIDVVLEREASDLDEVVVTSFGIEREKRELGFSQQDVDDEELTEAQELNVVNSLSGRVAGVDVTQSGSGITASSQIVIRGETSLSGNNKPLFVVDGVPIDNSVNTSTSDAQTSQVDFGDALTQLNPNDIEEISVLKGPNAAALYGSRANNGVVLITTKSGSESAGLGVSFNSNVTFEDILRLPDYQNEYGAGSGGEYKFVNGDGTDGGIDGQGYNWGPPLDGREITQFGSPVDEDGNLVPIPFEPHPDNVRNFFQTGGTVSNNIAVQGAHDRGHFRTSVTRLDKSGIVPNTDLSRTNLSFSGGYDFGDRLSVTSTINYAKTQSDNVPTSGYGSESIMYSFIWWGRHLQTDWLKDYWKEGQGGVEQNNFDNNWTNNIYFQVNENTNSMDKNRLFGNLSARLDFSEKVSLQLDGGLDYNDQITQMRKAFSTRTAPYGEYKEDDNRFLEYNFSFLLNYDTPITENWSFSGSMGGNHMKQDQRFLMTQAPELSVPGIYNFGNSRVNLSTSHQVQEKIINSLYGTSEFSYRDMLFFDITARNDWSSTLPTDNNSYFYPSVSMSAVLSDMFDIEDSALSYAKLRLGWAQVGNDTDPYRLRNTYNFLQAWDDNQRVEESAEIANEELKPEITTSYETGADIRFFDGRLGVDATYYFGHTRNQILSVPLPISSGYEGRFLNAGKISNQGWEVMLRGTPIRQSGGLVWDITLNWDRNRSTVDELAEGINSYVMGNPYGGTVEARVDGRMGDMYGRVFQRGPDGNIVYNDGVPQMTEEVQKIGNYNPDWKAGIGNRFMYRNVYLDVLFDYRHGGTIYSYTHATGIEGGTITGTTEHRNENVTGDGVMLNEDGEYVENDVEVPYVTYLREYYARDNIESNSFDATYLKLRELKIGYNIPNNLLERLPIRSASFSLVGRNLLLFTDVPHIDPETTYMSGSEHVPGFEVHQLPSTRSFGFNVNLEL